MAKISTPKGSYLTKPLRIFSVILYLTNKKLSEVVILLGLTMIPKTILRLKFCLRFLRHQRNNKDFAKLEVCTMKLTVYYINLRTNIIKVLTES